MPNRFNRQLNTATTNMEGFSFTADTYVNCKTSNIVLLEIPADFDSLITMTTSEDGATGKTSFSPVAGARYGVSDKNPYVKFSGDVTINAEVIA